MNYAVITVNFGNTKHTASLIKSIEKCNLDKIKIKVYIADNKSSKISLSSLKKIKKKSFLDIKIFPFYKNYYYWPAAEKILSNEIKKKDFPDRIIICNNDILFKDEFFFKKLLAYDVKKYPIIGPKILSKKKKDLNPFMIKPMNKFRIYYWKLFFSTYFLSIIFNFLNKVKNKFLKSKSIDMKMRVYAVHGSIVIFSKVFFEKGGVLDNGFKLFGEELTIAEISKKISCKITYVPELVTIHNEHSTISKFENKELYKIAKESHKYFINKYFNNNSF